MIRIFLLMTFVFSSGAAQQTWFTDTFQTNPLEGGWVASTPEWSHHGGIVRIETRLYDQLLASPWNVTPFLPHIITLRVRGDRAGVYFCLDRNDSKALSHMVRFEGQSLLAGTFDGGGVFQATGTMTLQEDPTQWTELTIAVDPSREEYVVSVNGRVVGEPQRLLFSSGMVGLQASEGVSEFDGITVSGAPWDSAAPKAELGEVPRFRHVEWVRRAGDAIEIYDTERHAILRLDARGRLMSVVDREAPDRTPAVTSGKWRYEIAGRTIVVTHLSNGTQDSLSGTLGQPWSLCAATDGDVYVADVGRGSVIRLSPEGNIVAEFRAKAIGGLKAPRGIALHESGELVIADYDRLVFTDARLSDPLPELGARSPTGAMIRWPRPVGERGAVRYRADGGTWRVTKAMPSRDEHSLEARLEGLDPLARHAFTVQPALKTIPTEASVSAPMRFSTPPADDARMAYTRLPLLCMIYRTMSTRDRYPADHYPHVPDGRTLTDDELQSLESAVRFNEAFFFRNSSCRLLLEFDVHVVEDTLWLGEIGTTDPYWLSPEDRVRRDFEDAARLFSKSPSDYNGLVVPYAWVNHPPRRSRAEDRAPDDSVSIRQAYGGGTYGVPAPWPYGATSGYTGNPFADRFSRQDWLITHEFHHQLDALMEASASGDYHHADMPWLMAGRFGEDFDFNAAIIRDAPIERWLTLTFGVLESTADADRDGVPDDDPSLPFDEKRLAGSPLLRDTDHDGLADLEELLAGTSRGSSLAERDTDGDGIIDGNDSEPLYPFPAERRRYDGEPRWDFGTIQRSSLKARFSLEWDDEFLLLFCETKLPVNLLLQIDATGDGWFHGFDNFQIRLAADADSVRVLDYYLRDCSSWVDAPNDRRDILRPKDLHTSVHPASDAGAYRIVVGVPILTAYGLDLRQGEVLGIRIGIQTEQDRWVWEELFERNAMMAVTLR